MYFSVHVSIIDRYCIICILYIIDTVFWYLYSANWSFVK